MELALECTPKSALCILIEYETVLKPLDEFIYVWVDSIHPDSATRLVGLSLILANCWQGANKGDSGSHLLSVLQAVETNHVMIDLFT